MSRRAGGLVALVALAAAAGRPLAFRFEPSAQSELRRLWVESTGARTERVACLAGQIISDTVRVTHILPLTDWADSLAVSAQQSLDECGPPQWQGTVHTHVALYTDDSPSQRFSGQDRTAMQMWYDRWHADGVFCVTYSEQSAHCEADGVVGGMRSRPRYVH